MSKFEMAFNDIVKAKIVPAIGRGDLVLIGGLAKLGKSPLAVALAAELERKGFDATVVSLDRWILSSSERMKPGVENRFDLQNVLMTLSPWLKQGRALAVTTPDYDRITRTRRLNGASLTLDVDAVLILEGVPALLLPIETRRKVYRIYVTGDETVRRDRVIDDLLARGIESRAAAEGIYRERQSDEAPRIKEGAANADYIVELG